MSGPVPGEPPELARIAEHAAALYALEEAAQAASAGPLRAAVTAFMRFLTRQWVSTFGSTAARANPVAVVRFVGEARGELRTIRPNVAAPLSRYAVQAQQLGARHAVDEILVDVDLTALESEGLSADVQRVLDGLDDDLAEHLSGAGQALGDLAGDAAFSDAVTAASPAAQAAASAERAAAWVTNRAANDGVAAIADELGVERIWIPERDACFIPSTRVLAPSVLRAPAGATAVMTGDPLDGLTPHPTAGCVVLAGDPGALTTAAVAGAVRDRFREVQAVSSREYVGDVVEIRTASGKQLTGTPNHPIATCGGWVPLGELKMGDHVLSRTCGERVPLGVHPDDDHAPPTIEQVAQSFPVTVGVVPTAAEDFHGDGAGSDVHVVRTDGSLLLGVDPTCPEHGHQLGFERRDVELAGLDGAGLGFLSRDGAASSSVRGDRSSNDGSATFRAQGVRAAEVVTRLDVEALEPAAHGVHVDAVDHGDFLRCLAPFVEPDEIVSVWRGEFRGHVYNLQTSEGWYLAEGIVAHNCVHCLGLAGETSVYGVFDASKTFATKPLAVWPGPDLTCPPRHPNCRCRTQPWLGSETSAGVPDQRGALQREAARSILTGWRLPSESERVRLGAAERLLLSGTTLPSTVQARARAAITRGSFDTFPRIKTRATTR